MTANESSRADARLVRRKEDLLRRAALVTVVGWDQVHYQRSTGEVLGTALVLQDADEILRWGETVASALSRWAFDLWGIDGGQTDLDAGCPTTLAWFDSIRSELTGTRSTTVTTEKG
ncbi:hypothetical protein K3U93_21580 [Mycobacterium malmoense]|uniref:Uncharacterized protein n=1 Tax=Mycobacterium malmoense TaxID=1780 RepID=A0ABX3SXQ5_MYCMA|nr:hypothetical protein [Mycobacterium malmoense]OIN79055.1 hypothetical protein BMG05_19970 [Mycobacterium malmoense]ORA84498.1 hypothetical protein BST29_05705 [Mycobacterium malmoense]QZA17158.1 hypothetical protein K3U93_21580 [Mycobacterium malmoense]UNB93949.1 hypothetical protein H5T25_21555 [Mycobacterium malmoense]